MWTAFGLLMIVMLVIDLGMNCTSHTISSRKALIWRFVWISLALVFNAGIYLFLEQTKAIEFFTGIELLTAFD